MILYFLLILLLVLILLLDVFPRFKQAYKTAKKLPGSFIYPIIGSTSDMLFCDSEQIFNYMRNQANRFKTNFRVWFNGRLVIHIIRAREAEIILTNSKFNEKSFIYEFLHPFLGTGLLTSGGPKWLQRRKILTPAFHFNILKQFFQTIRYETDNLIENVIKETNDPAGTDVSTLIARYTLNTISETAMGIKLNRTVGDPDEYRKKIHEIAVIFVHRVIHSWLHIDFINKITLNKYKFEKLVEPVHRFTQSVIDKRRKKFCESHETIDLDIGENIYETNKNRYAMLDTLLAAESRNEIDNEGIREEVDTFMFEGHDTTASGLILTLLLLAHHPDVQERIYEELMQTVEENNFEELEPQHYHSLKYLERVIKESLRIYPPVPFISRTIKEEMIIDGLIYPPNTVFHIQIYDIHRDPIYFPNPEVFNPDRFLPELTVDRHPFTYIPFSAGSRNCIGQKYAFLQMKLLISKLIRKYHILPVTKRQDVVFVADLVLRTKDHVQVRFSLRK